MICQKPAGVLSQKSQDVSSFQQEIETHVGYPLHILTRLDRPVSGLVLFSKTSEFTKHYIREQDRDRVVKKYLGFVEGNVKSSELVLDNYHYHDKKVRKARISDQEAKGYRPVRSQIEVSQRFDNYTLLAMILLKGAFHQLRAQISHIGHPIKGDVKYGARRGNKDRSIHLHSHSIEFAWKGNQIKESATIPQTDKLWQMVEPSASID